MEGYNQRNRKRARYRDYYDDSEISCWIKYLVFGFNIFFWLLGCALLAVALWAWSEQDLFRRVEKLTFEFWLDPVWFILVVGAVMFMIGFFGCIGALRENTPLLLIYCVAVGVVLAAQLGVGILIFVYKDKVKMQVTTALQQAIVGYRKEFHEDLRNLIDWVQGDWLNCCGIHTPNDWDSNIYFNCSVSKSRQTVESCGVPFSCCVKPPSGEFVNRQCGYNSRRDNTISEAIHQTGCFEKGEDWLKVNLIPVAAVIVSIALLQILGICFAQNLRHDIKAQRSKWETTEGVRVGHNRRSARSSRPAAATSSASSAYRVHQL